MTNLQHIERRTHPSAETAAALQGQGGLIEGGQEQSVKKLNRHDSVGLSFWNLQIPLLILMICH
jgi:hypothetical protein